MANDDSKIADMMKDAVGTADDAVKAGTLTADAVAKAKALPMKSPLQEAHEHLYSQDKE